MMEKNIKVVILCGGKGSRLAEETKITPKPMIKIGNLPILIHIMKKYYKHGFKNFVLALGYKKEIIIDYFKRTQFKEKWNVELVNTGKDTLTAKRLLKLKNKLIKNEIFLLTYGDGLSNLNINKLSSDCKKILHLCTKSKPTKIHNFFEKSNELSISKTIILQEIKWLIKSGIIRQFPAGEIEMVK